MKIALYASKRPKMVETITWVSRFFQFCCHTHNFCVEKNEKKELSAFSRRHGLTSTQGLATFQDFFRQFFWKICENIYQDTRLPKPFPKICSSLREITIRRHGADFFCKENFVLLCGFCLAATGGARYATRRSFAASAAVILTPKWCYVLY